MKMIDQEVENARLEKALRQEQKKTISLTRKNEALKKEKATLKKELKKKDVRKVVLTPEQEQLLLIQFPDIDSLLS